MYEYVLLIVMRVGADQVRQLSRRRIVLGSPKIPPLLLTSTSIVKDLVTCAQNFAWIDVATTRLDIWVVREERRHRDTRSTGDRSAGITILYHRDRGTILVR